MAKLYETLGVKPDATPAEIKSAYRKRAKKAHPDGGGSPEKFGALAKAYDVLSNERKRAQYDKDGTTEFKPDRSEQEAMELIALQIQQLLDAGEDHGVDVLDAMRQQLAATIEEQKDQCRMCRERIKKYENIAKRFKHKKSDKPDLIANLINGHIDNVTLAKKNAERKIDVLKLALGMIDEYEYTASEGGGEFMSLEQLTRAYNRGYR